MPPGLFRPTLARIAVPTPPPQPARASQTSRTKPDRTSSKRKVSPLSQEESDWSLSRGQETKKNKPKPHKEMKMPPVEAKAPVEGGEEIMDAVLLEADEALVVEEVEAELV